MGLLLWTLLQLDPSTSIRLVVLRDSSRLSKLLVGEYEAVSGGPGVRVSDSSGRLFVSCHDDDSRVRLPLSVEKSMKLLVDQCATPEALIEAIRLLALNCPEGWTIRTETIQPLKCNRPDQRFLLMALAQVIHGPPNLSSKHDGQATEFNLLETDVGWFFGNDLRESPKIIPPAIATAWKKRDFQFSAAMSLEVAMLAVSAVLATARVGTKCTVFTDPCAGTGTSLLAAALVLQTPLELVGSDVNEQFVQGCRANLERLFSSGGLTQPIELSFFQRDAAEPTQSRTWKPTDVGFINLPWGENKPFESYGDDIRIVRSFTNEALKPEGSLCLITRERWSEDKMLACGLKLLRVIGLDEDAESRKKQAGKCFLHICHRKE